MKTEDINKLHAEGLQLRNQQFQIVTLALASTGISAWVIPAVISGDNSLDDLVIVTATISWIILLGVLFSWSLALKRLIDIISNYLKINSLSDWESDFYLFDRSSNIHIGQTLYSLIIFLVYGIIVTTSGFIATQYLVNGFIIIGFGLMYMIYCIIKYSTRSKSKQIIKKWNAILKSNHTES